MYLSSKFRTRTKHSGQRLSLRPVSLWRPIQLVLTVLLGMLLTGSATYGQTGAALDFDGFDDYVNIGSGIPNMTTFTLEAWVKPANFSAADAGQPIEVVSRWGQGGAGAAAYRMGFFSNGTLIGAVYDGANESTVTSTASLTVNTWNHIAFTRSSDNTLRIYINGVLAGTKTGSLVPQASNYPVYFGKGIFGDNRYKGSLDEVRIWNRALLACEITNQRNCELPSGQTGLVAYYNFNQGTAGSSNSSVASVPDLSGNNYAGTLNGFGLTGTTSNWVAPGGVTSGVSCAAPVVISANSSLSISAGNFIRLTASNADSYVWSTGASSLSTIDSPTSTTVYSVTGTTVNGCSVASTTVTVAPALTVSCNTYQTINTANGLVGIVVNKVVAVGNNVYAATNGGLAISTDGGRTFTNRTTANGLGSNPTYSLQIADNTLYVGHNTGLSISKDGGESFTNSPQGLIVSAVFAQGNTVYMGIRTNVFKSNDGGKTFNSGTRLSSSAVGGTPTITDIYATGNTVYVTTERGFFISTDGGSSFSFINPGTLNQTSIFVKESTIFIGTTGGLYSSTDGGQTFIRRTTSDGLIHNFVRGVYAIGTRVYVATDGGLSISTDDGQTFKSHTLEANGLAAAGVRTVAVQGERVYTGTSAGLSIPSFRMQTVLSGTNTTLLSTTLSIAPNSSATIIAPEPNNTYIWNTGSNARSISVTATGIYSVTATGACPGSSSISITVLQPTSGPTLGTLTTGQCPASVGFPLSGQNATITGPGGYSFKTSVSRAPDPSRPISKYFTGVVSSGVYTIKNFDSSGKLLSIVDYPVIGGCN